MTQTSIQARVLLWGLLSLIIGVRLTAQTLICPDSYVENMENGIQFSANWDEGLSTGTKYIPTVVHLIGDASALTNTQVTSAIDQLNADFIDPSGNHTVIFVLATIGPKGNCTDGIARYPWMLYTEQFYKSLTGWPNHEYFNIWVVSDPNVLGQVQGSPSIFSINTGQLIRVDRIAGQNANFDGTDGLSINTTEIYPNSTGGHTLTHETGHWLNLLHVFAPCENVSGAPAPTIWNCCHDPSQSATQGDFIDDTPSQFYFTTSNPADCGQNITTCNGASVISQDNFMSYGGPCIDKFTIRQWEWMTHCLDNFRPYIWSEENLHCTGVVSQNNPTITSGQTVSWDVNSVGPVVTVRGTLTVEPGASLTIASGVTVQFCDQGRVIIKPGGALHHYGTLTSTCNSRMWMGVEVWGNKLQTQLPWPGTTQGKFNGYAGSLIEHAKVGIWVNNPEDATGNSTGGIVNCTVVTFKNNARALQFDPYENIKPWGGFLGNLSSLTACTFETNNDYRGDNPEYYAQNEFVLFRTFVDLLGIRGITFTGCIFQNLRNNTPNALETFYGYGILSKESSFSVTDFCTTPPGPTQTPCSPTALQASIFKNLYTGIWAGDTGLDGPLAHSYLVRNSHFEGNWTGIRSTAGSRGTIVQNTFNLGFVPPNLSQSEITQQTKGIVMDDTHTSFTVQENHFVRDPLTSQDVSDYWKIIGIEVVSVGEMNNLIRKNYFTNLKTGNYSWGANANSLGTNGLLYLCNENAGNEKFDFQLHFASRVKSRQALQGPTLGPAGNYFSHAGPIGSYSDFENRFDITYYHSSPTVETPEFFDANHFALQFIDVPRSCESVFCVPPCRTTEELALLEQLLETAIATRDSMVPLMQAGGADATTTAVREALIARLDYEIHTTTADVVTHITSSYGDQAQYRAHMAAVNAYDTDLALANNYISNNESSLYQSLMNGMASKYQFTDNRLDEFSAYKAITDAMAQHYANGGSKYNLSQLQIGWLVDIADNSPYQRARGLTRRILRIYGYDYPVDYTEDVAERTDRMPARSQPEFFSVYPNPANDRMIVHVETGGSTPIHYRIKILNATGEVILEEKSDNIVASGDSTFSISFLQQGIYWVQVCLDSGRMDTKRIVIIH